MEERSATSGHTARVLVVDDEEDMRYVVAVLLRQEGFSDVAEATDGHEAIEVAHAFLPDVVILDWRMPRLSGGDALSAIRAVAPETFVIVYSAEVGERDALDAGADAFVSKASSPRELMNQMRRLLSDAPGS